MKLRELLKKNVDGYFPKEEPYIRYDKEADGKRKKFLRAVISVLIWVVSSGLCLVVIMLLPLESKPVKFVVAIVVFVVSSFLGERFVKSRF